MRSRVIALDVGGTSLKSAVIAAGGEVASEVVTTPVDSAGRAEAILGTFTRVIANHLRSVAPAGLAVGFPGPFDYAAGVCHITGVEKFDALYGLDLRHALRERLSLPGLPILFRNDAEAALIGEARYGAGRRRRRLIGVTLGTGFGSAFVVEGRAVAAGPGVPANGWLYPVEFGGQRADDCFSRRGLLARLRAAGSDWLEVKPAAEAARGVDRGARQVFEAFGADLGEFLSPFAEEFKAEAVLVAGRMAGAWDLFAGPMQRALGVPVLAGELGARAALLGAADLIFNPQADSSDEKRTIP